MSGTTETGQTIEYVSSTDPGWRMVDAVTLREVDIAGDRIISFAPLATGNVYITIGKEGEDQTSIEVAGEALGALARALPVLGIVPSE